MEKSPLAQCSVLCAVLLAAGCASPPAGDGAGPSRALRVRLIQYGRPDFELVSTSHTSRVQLYSEPRPDASRKVQMDEVMAALVDLLDGEGMDRFGRTGSAPAQGGGMFTRALEVSDEGIATFWGIGVHTTPEERAAFNECMTIFIGLFDATQGLQTVENEAGADYFGQEKTEPSPRRER